MNELYEFGGLANVLIKLKNDKTIGGVEYKAGEPYTLLKNVAVSLDYEQMTSNIAAKKPISSSQTARPSRIGISNIEFTQKICNLILDKQQINKYIHTKEVKLTSDDGTTIFLPSAATDKNVFIYDQNLAKIPHTMVENDRILGNFLRDTEYLIFYNEEVSGNVYSFEMPHYGYFSLEITSCGNSDKNTNYTFMSFDAAALVTVPNFNISAEDMLNTPLIFDIIYEKQKEPILAFGG